jgi:hypothetical protein
MRGQGNSERQLEIEMSWFERSQRSLEIELIGLAVAHIHILDLLDECLDGALGSDEAWTLGRKAVGAIARKLGSDLGFDRIAEEVERRMASDVSAKGDVSWEQFLARQRPLADVYWKPRVPDASSSPLHQRTHVFRFSK